MPGTLMRTEMAEQGEVLARLVERREDTLARVRAAAPARLAGVLLLARGSSDNAALHARYLLELATARPVALAAPSLWTRYGARTDLDGWVVVAVSQSGRTPEIVSAVQAMEARGARTVAVTNGEDSDLARTAHASVALGAGAERAVPATKTVTSSLLALAHVAAALGDVGWSAREERAAADAVQAVLDDEGAAEQALERLSGSDLVHLGRGFTLAVALEAALKVKETTTVGSRGYASGDFLHGPVSAVGTTSAVVGYAAAGPTHEDVLEAVRAAQDKGARALLVSDAGPAPAGAGPLAVLAVPGGVPEPLVALPMLVRAQQLALHATLRAGLDPDAPTGLSKVTSTH
jgi:glutamine---fructose-6-phosphate transaminase (isomerizing)